jgi:hypothetical protein
MAGSCLYLNRLQIGGGERRATREGGNPSYMVQDVGGAMGPGLATPATAGSGADGAELPYRGQGSSALPVGDQKTPAWGRSAFRGVSY